MGEVPTMNMNLDKKQNESSGSFYSYRGGGVTYDIGIRKCAYEGNIHTQKYGSMKTVFLNCSA